MDTKSLKENGISSWGNERKNKVRDLFFNNEPASQGGWPKQKYPLSWLLEKFWPVPGWSEEARAEIKAWPLQNNNQTVLVSEPASNVAALNRTC